MHNLHTFILTSGLTTTNQELLQNDNKESEMNLQSPSDHMKSVVRNISRHLEDMKLQDPTDTNCSSDSDNQSIVSLNEVNYTKGLPEDFVMVRRYFYELINFIHILHFRYRYQIVLRLTTFLLRKCLLIC